MYNDYDQIHIWNHQSPQITATRNPDQKLLSPGNYLTNMKFAKSVAGAFSSFDYFLSFSRFQVNVYQNIAPNPLFINSVRDPRNFNDIEDVLVIHKTMIMVIATSSIRIYTIIPTVVLNYNID
jgi:hypothetical protein